MIKTALIIAFVCTTAFGTDKNLYFQSDSALEKWFWDSSEACDRSFLSIEQDCQGLSKSLWRIKTYKSVSGLCGPEAEDYSIYLLYDLKNDSLVCGCGYIAGIPFDGDTCIKNNLSAYQLKRTAKIANHFVTKHIKIKEELKQLHSKALAFYKSKNLKGSAALALPFVTNHNYLYVKVSKENVEQYNDFGFFLEQGGNYKEAVILLKEIVFWFPNRTPAWLNLGDAQFSLKKKEDAKNSYKKYIVLMKKEGKETKIPIRVLERIR